MWKRIFIAYALFLHYWFVSLRFVKLIVMDREQLFKDFKEKCVKRPEICGQGNPNADILIIGKEPAGEEFEDTNCQEYLDFLKRNYEECGAHCFVESNHEVNHFEQKYPQCKEVKTSIGKKNKS